ncbi:unnamed protein product [Lactuca virosa]|uniref:Protein kinase domain-containing protein n=1 Tax=Lactuca virosa TaxID=75947 RepID=A0AAU9NS11_9ASTR|nr:unnamed protein product [Lactuca virosa]
MLPGYDPSPAPSATGSSNSVHGTNLPSASSPLNPTVREGRYGIPRAGSLSIQSNVVCKKRKSGRFRYQPGQVRAFGMITGGSGITPMFQVVRAVLENPSDKTKVHLIYANVTSDDILLKARPGFVFVKPPEGWTGGVGLKSLPVAVKVLNKEGLQGHREWLTEVNFLGQLRHPNLVKLIGYCCEDDHRLLVYEFMFRGSLENHLFRISFFVPSVQWHLVLTKAAITMVLLHIDQARYLSMIPQIKEMITRAGKKAYTLVMGRPNPSKLANFPELDIQNNSGQKFWQNVEFVFGKELMNYTNSDEIQLRTDPVHADLDDEIGGLCKQVATEIELEAKNQNEFINELESLKKCCSQRVFLVWFIRVLMEPGTPHGSNIISQVQFHILWMEKTVTRIIGAGAH